MEAFVYCWKDNITQKQYIGWHKGSVDDGYVCSSSTMLEVYRSRPETFDRTIVAEGSSEEMVTLERSILEFLDAASNPMYYNLHNGGRFVNRKPLSEQAKKRISAANKGRKLSPFTAEHRAKIAASKIGTKASNETRAKLSFMKLGKSVKQRPRSEETKSRIAAARKGKTLSEETKKKIGEARKAAWKLKALSLSLANRPSP